MKGIFLFFLRLLHLIHFMLAFITCFSSEKKYFSYGILKYLKKRRKVVIKAKLNATSQLSILHENVYSDLLRLREG